MEEGYMRVHPEFLEIVRDYRRRFKEKHGVTVNSDLEATLVIAKKIKSIGGIKV